MLRSSFLAGLLALAAPAAWADVALLIANERYAGVAAARGAGALLGAERDIARAGFRTDVATDLSAAAMRAALAALSERLRAGDDERVVIGFAGYAVHSPQGTWLLGTDTRSADLATLDATGVRLDTILAIAGELQGGALVAIADLGFPGRPGAGLTAGLPPSLNVPQGVTVARAPTAQLATFLRGGTQPGANLAAEAARDRQMRLEGFVPRFLSFVPSGARPPAPTPAPVPQADRDATAWAEAQAAGTVAGFQTYLDQFPQGRFATQARAALDRLDNTPERIEARLNLTRDERRAVQRHLALLGFDPRGIDGVFGPGSRTAITSWQRREGLTDSGFLDRDQVFRLASQAARRAAELEEEERRREVEQERRDRAWWRDTGAGQDETGLRAYLERYPQGIFAAIARERLAEIEARREAERRAEAEARDRAAWSETRSIDTLAAYRGYLESWPNGLFAAEARDRIAALSPPPVVRPDPADVERSLRLPRLTRVLIEQRLALSGFSPGRVDGEFDRETRQAIRGFQRSVGLAETGFLDEAALDQLLPGGGLLRLIE